MIEGRKVCHVGSKQALSNGNEPMELEDLLLGFQNENQVYITLSMQLMPKRGKPALLVTAVATNIHVDPVVRARWASVEVVLSGKEFKNLMGLVTTLLYQLDFKIGEAEMNAIGIKKA